MLMIGTHLAVYMIKVVGLTGLSVGYRFHMEPAASLWGPINPSGVWLHLKPASVDLSHPLAAGLMSSYTESASIVTWNIPS